MEREISDEDIKPLVKITLLTHTNATLTVSIPFFKRFTPTFALVPNSSIFFPLFHTIKIKTKNQFAEINLSPLLEHLNEEHILQVQTYLNENKYVEGSKYALHVEFAQMVVWENESNTINLLFKRLGLIPGQDIGHLKPFIKVYTTHGGSWTGKSHHGQQSMELNQSMALTFKSLLDTVTFQVWNNNSKMCECQKYVFEFLSEDYTLFNLGGESFKGQLKVKATTSLPIVIID